MKKLMPFLLASSLFLLATSCKKDDPLNTDKLPPATTSGKNTFGCKVNGEVWIPYIEGGGVWDRVLNVDHDRGWVGCDQLYIGATKKYSDQANISQVFAINVWCPIIGENEITPTSGIFVDFRNCGNYRVDSLSPHILIITKLDTIDNIASGNFEFTAINDDCGDTIRITEGRFDADSGL
jgi:hypothetical protein